MVIFDRPIVTPIPKSVLEFVRRIGSGSILLTAWRALLVVALVGFSLGLAATGGIVAGFIAAIVLTMLIQDPVRSVVRDLWDMNFVRVNP
ncbi:hypothetical protein BB347_18480 (plasmid) [Natronorubrum daqingense]|uniref:Uncharacterized protein n=1 Tax=Natronorubrum daqingense TaxID=588898 RepID=A0A1P8RJ77_9EURY|nr:hypothetical protein BB347_18480 [Natronorubrum daqingense]